MATLKVLKKKKKLRKQQKTTQFKDGQMTFATTWMELEGIMLSEISQRKTKII